MSDEPKRMSGLFNLLSDEQRVKSLNVRENESFGPSEFMLTTTKTDLEAAMQAYSDARDNLDRPAMTAAAEQYRKAVMRQIEQDSKK